MEGANIGIGQSILLGDGRTPAWSSVYSLPAADIRSCLQYTNRKEVPEGYTGEWDEGYIAARGDRGVAVLGGSVEFMADEIEVLQAAPFISSAAQMGVCLSVCLWLSLYLFLT